MKKVNKKPALAGQLQFTTPYEVKQLSTGILFSGQPYQRNVRFSRVKEIIDSFDPMQLDEIIVSFRRGVYYVVDGQHRIAALKMMNDGDNVMVDCKIAHGLSYEQEAELYEKLDACKKKLTVADSTRAKAEAKNDPMILDIQKIFDYHGIKWAFSSKGGKGADNSVSSARATINAYKLLGSASFNRMVKLIKTTWGGAKDSLNSYMLSGMALFVDTYKNEIDDRVFAKKLSKILPQEIISAGRTDVSTRNTALKFARVILGKYNGRARENTLPYKFNG